MNEQVLTEELELKGTPKNEWEPIGNDYNHLFQGTLDGNNYTVSGVYVKDESNSDVPGFFGYISGATIKNLSLIDSYTNGRYTSALAYYVGYSDSATISRCFVEALVNSTYSAGVIAYDLENKSVIEYCYTTGRVTGSNLGGLVYTSGSGTKVRNCFSAVKDAPAFYSISSTVENVYFDSNRAESTSNIRDDYRSAETTEMLSTDFAARMGEPFEYSVGYYPYIYGLHKIGSDGKTSIVQGYTLFLGTLENGNDCNISFYRAYKKKTKELSAPVASGDKVFVDNSTTIYAQVSPAAAKRLSDEGLNIKNKTGNVISVEQVDFDLYSFHITDAEVTVSAKFVLGGYCGNPEENNGRDMRWQLSDDKATLIIAGAGNMFSNAWTTYANNVTTIEVGDGVTGVKDEAFKGMNKATTATMPATLTTIGNEAFSGCATTVDLRPCTLLTALHANEFAQFTGTLYLPATVTTIEADAFAGTHASVQHVYSPVTDGMTLFVNDVQVPDVDGMGDIARYGITANQEVLLVWGTGYLVTAIANSDGNLKVYADEALSKEIPEGYKAIRTDDQTRIYVKVEPKNTKILFLNGLTVKSGSSTLTATQESDEVFSFLMPKSAVTISAQFATGGYCGNTTVNNGHNLIWTLDSGELAFQKNSFAQGSDVSMGNDAPWSTLGSNVRSVDLDGITNIGSNAFTCCTNLVGLELPATPVVAVGDNAFANQMVLIIPAESWDSYQNAGWAAYAEQTVKDKETLVMANGLQWRTYYSKVGRMLPSGLKAYTVTSISNAEVEVGQPLNYVPAGKAVLIENSTKTACTAEAVTSLENSLKTTDESNLLQWLTTPKDVTVGEGYTLYKDEFVMVSSGTLPANIAFLPAGSSNAARRLTISGSIGEVTDIDSTTADTEDESEAVWYSLDGKKLTGKPSDKGIYLRNGIKVVIK